MAEPPRSDRGRVFISYRREETAYAAGWLFDRLVDRLGDGQVFKDVDSIEPGDDFVEVITTAVGSCDILLALIGDEWLTITGEDGKRRLDDPEDFVRLEIEAALARDVRVIPILVDTPAMPGADELPPSLAALARRQALELSPSRFDFDISRLLKVLTKSLAEVRTGEHEVVSISALPVKPPAPGGTSEAPGTRAGRRVARPRVLLAVGLAAVLVAVLIGVVVARSDGGAAGFEDDFSNAASGWSDAGESRVGGHFANGAYRIYAANLSGGGSVGSVPVRGDSVFPTAPRDLRIDVDARKLSAADQDTGYGIACRSDGNVGNAYIFTIWSGQRVSIAKLSYREPFFKPLRDGESSAVSETGPNHLQAACSSGEGERVVHLAFSVNGQPVAEAVDTDDPLLVGTVGLLAATGGKNDVSEAEFDDFVVTED